jgi:UDP-N-acetylmuramate--alanine ligase
VLNSLPVIGFCLELGLPLEAILISLKNFHGAGRRFEIKGECEGVTVIDDYGHHPNEIKATLEAASSLGAKRVVVVFQPHRYSRTLFLSQEFGRCFDNCDKLFITDIYAASEKPIPGVTSKVILDHMPVSNRRKVKMVKNVDDVKYMLLNYVEPGDVIFTMGAGSITRLGNEFLESMRARSHEVDFNNIPASLAAV